MTMSGHPLRYNAALTQWKAFSRTLFQESEGIDLIMKFIVAFAVAILRQDFL
jgi:hypothetical protein